MALLLVGSESSSFGGPASICKKIPSAEFNILFMILDIFMEDVFRMDSVAIIKISRQQQARICFSNSLKLHTYI